MALKPTPFRVITNDGDLEKPVERFIPHEDIMAMATKISNMNPRTVMFAFELPEEGTAAMFWPNSDLLKQGYAFELGHFSHMLSSLEDDSED